MFRIFRKLARLVGGLRRDRYWRRLKPSITLDSGVTVRLKSESDWFVFGEIFVRQDYDSALKRVFADPGTARPIRILDLGANSGLFSLRCLDIAANLGKEVSLTAVEGSPPTFATLKANMKPHGSARAFHGLVGQLSGSALIYASRNAFTNRIVADGEKASPLPFLDRTAFSVPYIDLDALCSSPVDLIKCDIEGAE
jgi:FkbM family methyltransferase